MPLHVPTMAFAGEDGFDDPGPGVVERYVTYERTQIGTSDCRSGGACRPISYVNTHNIYCNAESTSGWFAAAHSHPQWWLHAVWPSGSILTATTGYGNCPSLGLVQGNSYYANFTDKDDRAYWRHVLAAKAAASSANQCFFLDDVPYYLYHDSAEIPTADALFRAEGREFDDYAPFCIWSNGLGPGGGYYGSGTFTSGGAVRGSVPIDAYTRYSRAGNVFGVTFEEPLWAPSDSSVHTRNLPVMINTISRLLAETNLRIAVLDFSTAPDGSSLDRVRRLHTAALWLVTGSSLPRIVSWLEPRTSAQTKRPLGIYPEQLVVPTQPVKRLAPWSPADASDGTACGGNPPTQDGSSGGMADLLLSCGVYVREYKACYAARKPIGACAALVNLRDSAVHVQGSRLAGAYRYAIGWSGGPLRGVCPLADGCDGRLDLHAHRVEATIDVPPQDALLLAQ